MLLLPIEWTADGWFRLPPEIAADSAIPMPMPMTSQEPFFDPSDNFESSELGLQWGFWHEYDSARYETGKEFLRLAAQGKNLGDTSVLTAPVGAQSYTIEVDDDIEQGCEAGLLLFYNPEHATGITLGPKGISVRVGNGLTFNHPEDQASRATLRIVNDRQEIDFYFRRPNQAWQQVRESAEI